MILMVLPPNEAVSARTDIGPAAASASNDRYSRWRGSGTAGYCGRGACSRQAWLSPCINQPPHLSQPASVAPSRIMQAMRQTLRPRVVVRNSVFGIAGMATRAPRLDQ